MSKASQRRVSIAHQGYQDCLKGLKRAYAKNHKYYKDYRRGYQKAKRDQYVQQTDVPIVGYDDFEAMPPPPVEITLVSDETDAPEARRDSSSDAAPSEQLIETVQTPNDG